MEVNNLLRKKELTIIWLSPRFYSNSLGIVEQSTREEELCVPRFVIV